jgi:hypothetical protein
MNLFYLLNVLLIGKKCLLGAMGAEARLQLASNVTVLSNGFVFHKCITEDP